MHQKQRPSWNRAEYVRPLREMTVLQRFVQPEGVNTSAPTQSEGPYCRGCREGGVGLRLFAHMS